MNTDSPCSSPGAGRPACAVAGPRLQLMLAIQRARAAGFGQFAAALEQMLRTDLQPAALAWSYTPGVSPTAPFLLGAAECTEWLAAEPGYLARRRQAWRATRRSMDSRPPFGVPAPLSVSPMPGSGIAPRAQTPDPRS